MRRLSKALLADLKRYIDIRLLIPDAEHEDRRIDAQPTVTYAAAPEPPAMSAHAAKFGAAPGRGRIKRAEARTACSPRLEDIVISLDESFQEMLLRLIDERGMKDSTCYKRAGVDRKLFSKIRSNPAYKPKKSTAIAFIMALELDIDEAREMLMKAGYALSRSSVSDVIVEYFIVNGRYSIRELNEALYEYDQPII